MTPPQAQSPAPATAPEAESASAITVGKVNQYHSEYKTVYQDWERMLLLYEGGYLSKSSASSFLVRRPRELAEVYTARLDRFSYHSILGTCFGWYHASLFKNPPIIQMGKLDSSGSVVPGLDANLDKFYNAFRKNCDRKRTSLTELTRDLWTNQALFGVGYVLLDLPPAEAAPGTSLYAMKQTGNVDADGKPYPHLVSYSPLDVINWATDEYGILSWAVLRTQETRGDFLGKSQTVDCWIYFDRQNYVRYERARQDNEKNWEAIEINAPVQIVKSGPHALAEAGIVPLLKFPVTSALWLANRAYLPIVDHLNADNAYGWALYMANLAMPVIISDDEVSPTLSEAGFIRLKAGSSYTWSEPTGTSFSHASKRVEELRQEIFRLMYLIYQGRTANATADGASGASKEMDMMPAQDVMNEYGDVIVSATQQILDMVALARGDDGVCADVRGMKFGKTATLEQIQKTEAVLALAIPSDTFNKQVFIQAAAEYLPDANPEVLEKIAAEIEASPSIVMQMQAMANQRMQQFGDSIEGTLAQFQAPPQPAVAKTAPVQKKTARVLNQ